MHSGHGVTAEFRWAQIVSPVLAVSTAPMGVITPCNERVWGTWPTTEVDICSLYCYALFAIALAAVLPLMFGLLLML